MASVGVIMTVYVTNITVHLKWTIRKEDAQDDEFSGNAASGDHVAPFNQVPPDGMRASTTHGLISITFFPS